MAKKDEKGNWLDPRGNTVPQKFIPIIDRKRDKAVEDVHGAIDKLESFMLKTKEMCLALIEAYQDWLDKECNTKREGKGNLQLTNFSGDKRVEIRINDMVEFDERLGLAKTKIDECIVRWSDGSRDEIAAIVRQAFNLDKKGNVNRQMILRLLGLEIKDATWVEAMDLIRKSIQVTGSRQYIQMSRKVKSETGAEQWETINLNFSAM